MENSYLKLL